ncbi:MAG: hypothetical protein M1822_007371 [Bathelium mastoideum]|nr:MAG: hypothetical protein M1822_007371 [Bathelium mastoideum]
MSSNMQDTNDFKSKVVTADQTKSKPEQQVYRLAQQCNELFSLVQAQAQTVGGSNESELLIHSKALEGQERRFRTWATRLRVFAEPIVSLDSRLKAHPELRSLVIILLMCIKEYLQAPRSNYQTNLSDMTTDEGSIARTSRNGDIVRPQVQIQSELHNTGLKESKDTTLLPHRYKKKLKIPRQDAVSVESTTQKDYFQTDQEVNRVDEALQRLDQLSVRIQQTLNSDYSGIGQRDLTKTNELEFSRNVNQFIRSMYQGMNDGLAMQIHKSIVYRHFWLLERQANHKEIQEEKGAHLKSVPTHGEYLQGQDPVPGNTYWSDISGGPLGLTLKIGYRSVLDWFQETPFVECPTCFIRYWPEEFQTPRARRCHVGEDIKPYVCISEECDEPLSYFSRYSLWKDHMQEQHTEDWIQFVHRETAWACSIDHEDHRRFKDVQQLTEHISKEHKEHFAGEASGTIRDYAELNQIQVTRSQNTCPICQWNFTDNVGTESAETRNDLSSFVGSDTEFSTPEDVLTEHIANHLIMFSFVSLKGIVRQSDELSRPLNLFKALQEAQIDKEKHIFPRAQLVEFEISQQYLIEQDLRKLLGNEILRNPETHTSLHLAHNALVSGFSLQDYVSQSPEEQPNLADSTTPWFLTLGSRGERMLTTLYILRIFMERLNTRRKERRLPFVEPYKAFSHISGIGMGGYEYPLVSRDITDLTSLIAIMLGRLQMTVEQCISAYKRIVRATLEKKSSSLSVKTPMGRLGKEGFVFNQDKLRQEVISWLKDEEALNEKLLNAGHCRV